MPNLDYLSIGGWSRWCFAEKLEVGNVLGPGRNLLVPDHMLELDEGETVDDLGSVDQLVDVEISYAQLLPMVTAPLKQLTILVPSGSETDSPTLNACSRARPG